MALTIPCGARGEPRRGGPAARRFDSAALRLGGRRRLLYAFRGDGSRRVPRRPLPILQWA